MEQSTPLTSIVFFFPYGEQQLLPTVILQNTFFCVQQNKETLYTGFVQLEGL